ncbi:MAG: ferritin-like domain-containing protein [Chthoniobacterales bacterium]
MKIESLKTLLEEELKDIYSAEKQIVQALPKMVKKATSPDLKRALEDHLKATKVQVTRLESVFRALGKPAKAKTCKAMKGLLEEGKEILELDADDAVLDAGIIAAAQKVEHYEMASYGTVRTWARRCGENKAADLLQKTLDEEGDADKLLTRLAESLVNPEANDGDGDYNAKGSKSGAKKKSRSRK